MLVQLTVFLALIIRERIRDWIVALCWRSRRRWTSTHWSAQHARKRLWQWYKPQLSRTATTRTWARSWPKFGGTTSDEKIKLADYVRDWSGTQYSARRSPDTTSLFFLPCHYSRDLNAKNVCLVRGNCHESFQLGAEQTVAGKMETVNCWNNSMQCNIDIPCLCLTCNDSSD